MARLDVITDGIVVIRPPGAGDGDRLVAGRDDEFHRFMGPGQDDPCPTACILVDGGVVGWVDYDADRDWLAEGEVNVGYNVFAPARGRGYASRAVKLLLHHLALIGDQHTATLLIRFDNHRSLGVARRTGFGAHGEVNGDSYWKRPVPPLTYSDGTVTIRRADVEGESGHDGFGAGPEWTFTVDGGGVRGIAQVHCDLADERVPRGDATIACAPSPDRRERGHVTAAVRLVVAFLADHTGTRTAHIITGEDDTASVRAALAVGARPTDRWVDDRGVTVVTHTMAIV